MRNAQSGAPELVARIQIQKPARRAEVEWSTRYTKAKRSRGVMVGLPFLEKTRNFPARAWLVRAQFEQGVVRGD